MGKLYPDKADRAAERKNGTYYDAPRLGRKPTYCMASKRPFFEELVIVVGWPGVSFAISEMLGFGVVGVELSD